MLNTIYRLFKNVLFPPRDEVTEDVTSIVGECKTIFTNPDDTQTVDMIRSDNISVIVLKKITEQYAFIYDENNRAETLRLLGKFASNPELNFNWYDAAVLAQKIRHNSLQQRMKST